MYEKECITEYPLEYVHVGYQMKAYCKWSNVQFESHIYLKLFLSYVYFCTFVTNEYVLYQNNDFLINLFGDSCSLINPKLLYQSKIAFARLYNILYS